MKLIVVILIVLFLCSSLFAGPADGKKGLAGYVGYYAPSLKDMNDLLEEIDDEYSDPDITKTGSDKFGGKIIFGANFGIGVSPNLVVRGDFMYWKQTVDRKYSGEDFIGNTFTDEYSLTVKIIPIIINGLYYFETQSGTFMPYLGVGVGLAMTSWEAKADLDSQPGDSGTFDDSSNPFVFNLVGGFEYPLSSSLSLMGEVGYLIGNIKISEPDIDLKESISMSGLTAKVGIQLGFK